MRSSICPEPGKSRHARGAHENESRIWSAATWGRFFRRRTRGDVRKRRRVAALQIRPACISVGRPNFWCGIRAMTTIHPTAIVEAGAKLGADCEIMPYALVTKHCVLGDRVVVHPFA